MEKNESWIQILDTALFTILDGDQRIHKNLYCKSSLPIFKYINGYFEEISGNKYLTPVPTNERKDKIKKYEELWIKIVDLIRSITKSSDDYDKKYMKIKFKSDNELHINKMLEIPIITIFVRAIFLENNKHPQVFLDECLHKILK